MGHPDYAKLETPDTDDTPRTEWNYQHRRAELYDMIERAGHWRALNWSLRELGDRYGVAHATIRSDIDVVNEWEGEHLGDDVAADLSMLQRSAIKDYLEAARDELDPHVGDGINREKAANLKAKAYELASDHLDDLQATGFVDKEADKLDLEAKVEGEQEHGLDDETRELTLEAIRMRQQLESGGDDE